MPSAHRCARTTRRGLARRYTAARAFPAFGARLGRAPPRAPSADGARVRRERGDAERRVLGRWRTPDARLQRAASSSGDRARVRFVTCRQRVRFRGVRRLRRARRKNGASSLGDFRRAGVTALTVWRPGRPVLGAPPGASWAPCACPPARAQPPDEKGEGHGEHDGEVPQQVVVAQNAPLVQKLHHCHVGEHFLRVGGHPGALALDHFTSVSASGRTCPGEIVKMRS